MFKISARTVLELGSELISSDTIAFYELIKNAFDAKSTSGVEIRFHIVMRHNSYLKIRTKISDLQLQYNNQTSIKLRNEKNLVDNFILDVKSDLEISAGAEIATAFLNMLHPSEDFKSLLQNLDQAYRTLNKITISDTGNGMSLAELKENYLVIGTPSRKKEVDKAILEAEERSPYLGEKGIGRLSAMRLGERLVLETAKATDSKINLLDIDWRRFYDLDAMVEDIVIHPSETKFKKDANWSGTILSILDLNEDWTESKVRTLAEYDFARIIDPFLDTKLRPRIAIFWNETRIAIPWMDRVLIDQANASFKGSYKIENGEPILTVTLQAYNLGFKHPHEIEVIKLTRPDLEGTVIGLGGNIEESALMTVGNFEFEAYWYNRRLITQVEGIGDQKVVRELQRKWAGILLFRDGFRVFPYGDDDDDWLGLDRKALGRPGYGLNKAQFVGHISIGRVQNPHLVDQTNREGLRHTPQQQVFILLLQHIIQDSLLLFLKDVEKRHKNQPLDLSDVKSEVKGLDDRAKVALAKVRKLVPKNEIEVIEDLQHTFEEFQDLVSRAQARIKQVESDGQQMIQMAGVGLMIEIVAHELARATESALQAIETLKKDEIPTYVRSKLDTLNSEMKSVSKRLSVLDDLSVSGRQRSEVFDVINLINEIKLGHNSEFVRNNIAFEIKSSYSILRIKSVKGMLIQIFENLISNSVYWMLLKKERSNSYTPKITIQIETDPLTIVYFDNGRGIAIENIDNIFKPFWSLKEKAKRRGLGLYIAKENATYLGAQFFLSKNINQDTKRLHEFILEFHEGVVLHDN